MISNDRQLANTHRKLAHLQERARDVEKRLREEPEQGRTRVTLESYRGLIRQLHEEIHRYELGIAPPSRHRLETEAELQNTVAKLESLQRLQEQRSAEPVSPMRNLSLLSLRRTMNQLREEIAWYEAHHKAAAESSRQLPTHN
jgi:hypothetical protein